MSDAPLPQRYDPHAAAVRWSAAWEAAGAFTADPSRPGPAFTVVIPPPNVTGRLHMGHALNNTMQDVLVRYKRMDGFNALWVPGTDHAGIATQWVVRRQIEAEGLTMEGMGREAFLARVWAWKEQTSGNIREQLQRLGASADWSRERFTLDEGLQRAVTEHFVTLYEQGLIYRGQRMIHWDPVDRTAVSDLEVEYKKDKKGRTLLEQGELFSFAYPLSDGSGEIVVATTRPETMLGDTAIAVHPEDPRYKHLIGQTVDHPFVDRRIPIVGDAILVDPEFGTGAVKITPAHDWNDFAVGQRHGLEQITIFDEGARIVDGYGPFTGLDRYAAREAIKAALDARGLHRGVAEHQLPIGRSQRSGAVVEPRISTQWFVKAAPLAGPALAAIEHDIARFVPDQWANTYRSWMTRIEDWCISRQLWWGHRIPAWYDANGRVFVARTVEEAAERAGCAPEALTQDDDTLDTWFSSALWPFSVMGWPDRTADLARYYPTSVLVTAFDIIFFWVARMMMAGIHLTGSVPFRDIIIHTLVRDEHGEKMSKTKGNVVDPLEVIDASGADAFRFALMALAVQGADILWSAKKVEDANRFVTKVWQALRYTHMHLHEGFDPSDPGEPGPAEAWLAVETADAIDRVREALDAYRFHDATLAVHGFVWGTFCDWYLELSKTVLYDDAAPPARKQAARRALVDTLDVIARLLHPLMPFFSEELYHQLPGRSGLVATSAYPRAADLPRDPQAAAEVRVLIEAIGAVRTLRGEMELSPRTELVAHLDDAALHATLSRHAGSLAQLAGTRLGEGAPAGPCAVAVVQGHELRLPLEGVTDVAAELDRLAKALAKVDKDVVQLERKLGNEAFVSKAPDDVVAEFRDKLEAARIRQDVLRRNQARLSEGA